MKKGFATIYIVLILSSIMTGLLVIIEVAEGFGAKSVTESITTAAGESILSEYNKALYNRYGIFAVRNYEDDLETRAKHYIDGSSLVVRAIVHPHLDSVSVYTDKYPLMNTEFFSKQLLKLTPMALLRTFPKVYAREERSINNAGMPSRLYGYGSRESVLLSGGLFEVSIEKFIEDECIMSACSRKTYQRPDTYLAYESEYVLFGYSSDSANIESMHRSLYAVRFAVRLAEASPLPADPVAFAIAMARVIMQTEQDVDDLMSGKEVDGTTYETYLTVFLGILSREEKLTRLMDIMQININYIDGNSFTFKDYSYGFDMVARYSKRVAAPIAWGSGRRYRVVEQTHKYK
ncbi:MAG: DUF5702 domain-containing protein [Clostridia bacterium]|nr:DUF5702 domain-containing protein [Clostridia bacterium]